MDAVQAIFNELGADFSIFYQLGLVVALFVFAKLIFLDKLQNLLETREEKTIKLEQSAEQKIKKAQELNLEYRAKINEAHAQAQKIFTEKKNKIQDFKVQQLKQAEEETEKNIESTKKDFSQELERKRSALMNQTEIFAHSLVEKIVQ